MSAISAEKMPLRAAITQIFGYIYCMIFSSMMTDMPLYGGVLYLCGKAMIVFSGTVAGRNRKFLPAYVKRWVILLLVFLIAIGTLLAGVYPAPDLKNEKIWILFAAVALCLCAETNTDRLSRVLREGEAMSPRAKWLSILFQAVIMSGMSAIIFINFGWKDGWAPAAGFLLLVLSRVYVMIRLHRDWDQEDNGQELDEADFRNAHAYHSVEWVSLLLVMAVELTVTSIYALLATSSEGLLPAMAVAVLCSVLPAEAGYLLLRRSERKGMKDPTLLLCSGLLLWLVGIILCIQMLIAGRIDYLRIYICLVICTVGGSLSMTGLGRIEELIPEAVSVSGTEVPRGYWKLRTTNWNLARLLGDVLSLIALGIFCFINRKGIPQTTEELAARFQPVLSVPVFLVLIGALVCALRFPLSSRYIEKIRKLMKLQESGKENEALQQQVAHVVREPYRQPYLSRILMVLCRMHFRCKTVNADHIVTDDDNPLVFLCNHGEFYGPMACKMYIPVPIRAWAVAYLMSDKKSVAQYIYDNTTSRLNAPEFIKRLLARMAAWLCVNVTGQLECIPVYRDSPSKLRETFRMTLDCLEAGDNLLIFPEDPDNKYPSEGIGELSPGFMMLADIYWKRKKKRLRMLPMYADKKRRRLTFGNIITYNPENNVKDEQDRIITETLRQIREIAAGKAEGGRKE